jgi:hypothetical protein
MAFLQTPEAHEIWMGRQGFLTPHSGVNLDAFSDPTLRQMNEILLEATTFRFDASDLMPPAVGQGSFWTGMVDYAGGKDPPKPWPPRSSAPGRSDVTGTAPAAAGAVRIVDEGGRDEPGTSRA